MRETSEIKSEFAASGGDIIRDAFARAFQKAETADCRFEHGTEAIALMRALEQGGFEIVRKAPAGRPYIMEVTTVDGVTTTRTAELVPGQETAHEKAVRKQDEISARISEARRLGDWSRVTDADMLAMMSPIPGGRTYGNDHDVVGRTFSDAAGGTFVGAMRVVRDVTRLRDKVRTAWAGGRGTWDADAFARLQQLAPEIARRLDRYLTMESRGFTPTGRHIEVTYARRDGTSETIRHDEFLRGLDVSFDPPPQQMTKGDLEIVKAKVFVGTA